MKKTIFTLALLSVVMVSCSDDTNNAMNQERSANKEFILFTTSNTTGKVSVTDLNTNGINSFTVASTDADGAYYFDDSDELILASRTNNRVEAYSDVMNAVAMNSTTLSLTAMSTSDFTNAREIAVSGDKVVVTQDQSAANNNTNKLIVYQKTASGFMLLNSYTVNFKTWGIHLEGDTLYAVADLTGDLLSFENFFANVDGTILPTKRVTVEGLVRTHGITYSKRSNTMVLTDVGLAASDSDGGVIVLKGFTELFAATPNMGTIAMNKQIRIYGSNTSLGNPVDVAYDNFTKTIYVAERLNGGGKLLTFDLPNSNVNAMPTGSRPEPGVSSVYLFRE
ncbi:hypothetical protein HKT18_12445 [Flavobacterium sp. IMCC34852]|uniref:Lipoprotein n=1 Tax=Flavobacterium rivulicola TaxID=2732161 RepID=A0A7Y3RBR5_9FLAO|nr:hypothetical protein [Flavobacterium sp. IMCC34852]NNT73027.1 hypothetical protein [Flavobacterium sp. IMCC34852]